MLQKNGAIEASNTPSLCLELMMVDETAVMAISVLNLKQGKDVHTSELHVQWNFALANILQSTPFSVPVGLFL